MLRTGRPLAAVSLTAFLHLAGVSGAPAHGAPAPTASVTEWFRAGNDLYRQGQYREAIAQYQRVLDSGYESAELYYNLGNCYYRLRQIGKAVLYLERARRLAPNDEDIAHNLAVVQLQVVDKIPEIPRWFLHRWAASARDLLSLDQWTVTLLVLYLGTIGLAIVRVLVRKKAVQQWSGRGAVVLGALTVLVGLFWAGALHAHRQLYGVILDAKVDVRSGPEGTATELFSLHEGTRVQIRKQTGNWCEIRLPDGKVGWVTRSSLEVI
ncbi:MAG: tetratricopeptide repeat protein [candidate division KSB1 bacterium]|nr:tetratricopeptide repeat protein [candidate division KSB1 bacterium]